MDYWGVSIVRTSYESGTDPIRPLKRVPWALPPNLGALKPEAHVDCVMFDYRI
jgi:hypothetical protein